MLTNVYKQIIFYHNVVPLSFLMQQHNCLTLPYASPCPNFPKTLDVIVVSYKFPLFFFKYHNK